MGSKKDLTIRDPIHGMITFKKDTVARELIDTKEFQRLRRIKQLGFADLVYPGATHTRFSHSLGVGWLVNKAMKKLFEKGEIKEDDFKDYDKDQAIDAMTCAGLLHDIGHGPFSHLFEKITNAHHESIAKDIINPEDIRYESKISSKIELSIKNKKLPLSVKKDLPGVIRGSIGHSLEVVMSLIHSQLDCDRIDYLLRDNYFCGTPINVDVDFLFRSMMIKPIPILGDKKRIVFEYKSLPSIEHYLLSRINHYKSIAYHKTVAAAEALFLSLFKETHGSIFDQELGLNEFINYDENTLIADLKKRSKDNKYAELYLNQLLNRELPKFIDITECPYNDSKYDYDPPDEFYSKKIGLLDSHKDIDKIRKCIHLSENNDKYMYRNRLSSINRLNTNKTNRQQYYDKDFDIKEIEDVIFIYDKKRDEILDITKFSSIAKNPESAIDKATRVYTLDEYREKLKDARGS